MSMKALGEASFEAQQSLTRLNGEVFGNVHERGAVATHNAIEGCDVKPLKRSDVSRVLEWLKRWLEFTHEASG